MSRNKRTTHIIDSLYLLHMLLTSYSVQRSQLLKKPGHLEFIFSAYRVASYIGYTATMNLLFPRTTWLTLFTNTLDVTGFSAVPVK